MSEETFDEMLSRRINEALEARIIANSCPADGLLMLERLTLEQTQVLWCPMCGRQKART